VGRADELRTELELLELEDLFVAAKENGSLTAEMKSELREKRRAFRQLREGAAEANPAPITATSTVSTGGKK